MRVFAQSYVNESRQIFLDIAKTFSIIFMVWIHTFEHSGVMEGVGGVVVASSYVNFVNVVLGAVFADFLKRCVDLNKLMSVIFILSWTLFLPLFIYLYMEGKGIYSPLEISFYHMGIFGAFHALCGVFAFILLCYFLAKVLPGFISALCVKISNNITLIYWLQWIFILWFLFGAKLSEFGATITAFVIFMLSAVLAITFGKNSCKNSPGSIKSTKVL